MGSSEKDAEHGPEKLRVCLPARSAVLTTNMDAVDPTLRTD